MYRTERREGIQGWIKGGELEFTDRKQENWSFQIESRRLKFTDGKTENWSLQIESKRIGVYIQKVRELKFTYRK